MHIAQPQPTVTNTVLLSQEYLPTCLTILAEVVLQLLFLSHPLSQSRASWFKQVSTEGIHISIPLQIAKMLQHTV